MRDPGPAARKEQAGPAPGQRRQRSPACAARRLACLPVPSGVCGGGAAGTHPSSDPGAAQVLRPHPRPLECGPQWGWQLPFHQPAGRPNPHAHAAESFTKPVPALCLFVRSLRPKPAARTECFKRGGRTRAALRWSFCAAVPWLPGHSHGVRDGGGAQTWGDIGGAQGAGRPRPEGCDLAWVLRPP